MKPRINWIVSQIGARQHYGVPRGFYYKDELRLLYTDAWCRWGSSILKRGPGVLRAFAGRYHRELPSDKVIAFTGSALRARLRQVRSRTLEAKFHEHLRIGSEFSLRVNKHLARQKLDPQIDRFFGFNTGCLETLQLLRERGVNTVVDQIDPAKVEEDLVFAETQKWPGWQKFPGRIPDVYFERLAAEWEEASLVLVNSEWSKNALIKQGVPAAKLLVVPVAFETENEKALPKEKHDRPLTVLWLGTVCLRKGVQYLIEAAKRLNDTKISFVVAGPIEISQQAIGSAPPNVSFLGKVTRGETKRLFSRADLFVLPTLSDGFAITQVEAMAHGLPVITTPNCGSVVTHAVDGLIIPASDSDALVSAVVALDNNRTLLQEMSDCALRKSTRFHLPTQADQIDNAVIRLAKEACPTGSPAMR